PRNRQTASPSAWALPLQGMQGTRTQGSRAQDASAMDPRTVAEVPAEGGQLSESARYHDHAAAVWDEGKEGIRHVPRSEVIRFYRANRGASIGSPGADPRIVHEEVEARNGSGEVRRNGGTARALRHLQPLKRTIDWIR